MGKIDKEKKFSKEKGGRQGEGVWQRKEEDKANEK